MSRVDSKNLLQFTPKGEVDEDIRNDASIFDILSFEVVFSFIKYVLYQCIGRFLWPFEVRLKHQSFFEAVLGGMMTGIKGLVLGDDAIFVKGF